MFEFTVKVTAQGGTPTRDQVREALEDADLEIGNFYDNGIILTVAEVK